MRESTGGRWVRRIGVTALSAFVGFPLYVMVTASLRSLLDVRGSFRWLPTDLTVAPYRDMWRTVPLGRYLANSLVVSSVATVLALAVAVPAAHALARQRFRGSRVFGFGVLATQLVPGTLFLLPLFLGFAQVHRSTGVRLIGSYTGLVLVDLTFALPLSIWLLAGYFATLPREVEDAASLDGAGAVGVLLRIIVPGAAPGIVAVGTFAFTAAWGEVLFASVLTDDRTTTLPVGLAAFATQTSAYWNQLFAAALLASVPVLAAFLALRRFLVRGLRADRLAG